MLERSDIMYIYDGSFEGLLCCVFESYEKKELPIDIQAENAMQMTLYTIKNIDSNSTKANRVRIGIMKKARKDFYDFIEMAFYTCHPHKERLILDFIRLGMQHGKDALSMLTHDTVSDLQKAVTALTRESHQFKGFVRFSIYNQVMLSIIEPKNFVLPLLAPHFCDRYQNETFIIYDKTHGDALLYKPRELIITQVNDFELPETDEQENQYRSLWKLFYDTIAIDERSNDKCRMSHMQKRYWKHLTEMNDRPTKPLTIQDKQLILASIMLIM
ncbi:MAG: TIGR03915 family putative DNA repair protein [Hyphomonadaceae bacterium]|nr:TIGR03915 family putative DNA repair protein [Clostridia bacterium]